MKIAVLGGKREQAEVTAILLNAIGHECSVHGQGSVFLQSGQAQDYDFLSWMRACRRGHGSAAGGQGPRGGRAQPILLLARRRIWKTA